MVAVDDATPTLGAASACRVMGLPRASLYRGRRPVAVARPRPAPPRALDPIERQGILDLLHTRFIDQAPAQIHATCSMRGPTSVAAHDVSRPRRRARSQGAARSGAAPALRRARVTGHASERSLELGHHEALGSVEVDVLLSLRHPSTSSAGTWSAGCSPHTRARPWPSTSSARPARSTAFSRANSRSMRTAGRP